MIGHWLSLLSAMLPGVQRAAVLSLPSGHALATWPSATIATNDLEQAALLKRRSEEAEASYNAALARARDEAHRFANGYHQLLMKRRVEESILDDCPGVSERRKIALLKAFGSVARLRKATAEDIGKVAGVGAKLAEQLVAFLQTHRR